MEMRKFIKGLPLQTICLFSLKLLFSSKHTTNNIPFVSWHKTFICYENVLLIKAKIIKERKREKERETFKQIYDQKIVGSVTFSPHTLYFSFSIHFFSFLIHNSTDSIARSCFQVIRIEIKEAKFKCSVSFVSFQQIIKGYVRTCYL